MDLYAIHRRNLCTPDELGEVDRRSQAALDARTEQLRKIRSYVFDEGDGTVGTICVYQAADTAAIHEHARAAGLPVDDLSPITTIDVHRPDPDELLV